MNELLGRWFNAMLNRFKHSVLGIDISSVSVKALHLQKRKHHFHDLAYSCVPFSMANTTEALSASPTEIITALKQAIAYMNCKHMSATICVSSSTVMTKHLLLDATTLPEDIEENILILANQYIPYPLDDINYDFEVLGNNSYRPDKLDVLFIAAHRENINTKVDIVNKAGLGANIVDIDIYALKNACSLLPEYKQRSLLNQTLVIIDIGATHTTYIVIFNERVLYTRELDFGGRPLILAIQELHQYSYEEAAEVIKNNKLSDPVSLSIIANFITAMINELQHTQTQYNSANASGVIDCIFLAGGCGLLPHVKDDLERSLAIPVFIINPFEEMTLEDSIDKKSLYSIAPTLVIACGLAIRSFNNE